MKNGTVIPQYKMQVRPDGDAAWHDVTCRYESMKHHPQLFLYPEDAEKALPGVFFNGERWTLP